jgi:hypothetical protein
MGTAPEWKSTKVTEMTGDQLASAVRQGVLRAIAIWVFITAVVGFVFAMLSQF